MEKSKGSGFYVISDDGVVHKAKEVRFGESEMLCGATVKPEIAIFVEAEEGGNDLSWQEAFIRFHSCPGCKAGGFFEY